MSSARTDPWWATDPETGQSVRVLPAERVEMARRAANDADAKVDVLRESAARALVIFRRTRVLHDSTEAEVEQARRELRDALGWMARGAPEAVRDPRIAFNADEADCCTCVGSCDRRDDGICRCLPSSPEKAVR